MSKIVYMLFVKMPLAVINTTLKKEERLFL